MAPYSHLGKSRIKKLIGGFAAKLSYFLNDFSEEMNAHYVPLKVCGFVIRRYLGDAAYEDIIKPLDRIGLGNDYRCVLRHMYSKYHSSSDMNLAAHKLKVVRQRGMSLRDYVEWIKYLVKLAIPPNASAAEHKRREKLEVQKFLRTLEDRDARKYLCRGTYPNIDALLNALEEYYLIEAGPDGWDPGQKSFETSRNNPPNSINAIRAAPNDWRSLGAKAEPEDILPYLKKERQYSHDSDGAPAFSEPVNWVRSTTHPPPSQNKVPQRLVTKGKEGKKVIEKKVELVEARNPKAAMLLEAKLIPCRSW